MRKARDYDNTFVVSVALVAAAIAAVVIADYYYYYITPPYRTIVQILLFLFLL